MFLSKFINAQIRLLAVGLTCTCFGLNALYAQSATEAKFVMQDIENWLPGMYDNEPQTYLEAAFGVSADGPHTRSYIQIERLADPKGGAAASFQLNIHEGGKHQPQSRQLLWSFHMTDTAVAMIQTEATKDEGETNSTCKLLWRRGQSQVYAEIDETSECGAADIAADMRLSEDALWVLGHNLVGTREDDIHNKYLKANELECFVYAMHDKELMKEGDADRTVINPFYMHNRGDSFTFSTKERTPRTFTLFMRKSMWASRSGRNFVPLLSLALHAGPDTSGPIVGNAWAEGSSDRVGFDAGGAVGARCKHFTERRADAVN